MADQPGGVPAPRSSQAPERRFRDDEVSSILALASSRELRPDLPAPHSPTLSDLMSAAEEAGLDPGEVRRAAALGPAGPSGAAGVVFGAPDHREVTATLPGATIPGNPFAVVRLAESVLGGRGEVVEGAPGRFEWRSEGVGVRSAVHMSEGEGDLALRITADRAGAYLGVWFASLIAWALASALTPLGAIPLAAKLAGFLVGPVLLGRPFWARADRRLRARMETLALDILRLADEEGPAALPEGEDGGASDDRRASEPQGQR